MPTYRCVICQKETRYAGALPELYPFCSDRCKMVDLGRWFRESYTIDRDLSPDEADEPPNAPPTPPNDPAPR
jgi:uncharacterized protein